MKEKVHTTNYFNTFIEVADDCPVDKAETPPIKGDSKTIANIQFELIHKHPYKYSSDEVVFQCYALKNEITETERDAALQQFFSKGQPCLRSSPLPKRYGWGVHSNEEGKVALFPLGSEQYEAFIADEKVKKVKAMRSKKA